MANVQGRRHVRKNRRHVGKINTKQPTDNGMRFVYGYVREKQPSINNKRFVYGDDDYILENDVIGHLPFKEPEEKEIIFSSDKLWQDNSDGWSMVVLPDELSELSSDDEEVIL